jgi:predicted dithiol-disulfide oxidoreductase (DUF899 family)
MSLPDVVSREEWAAARTRLLAKEKAATLARDELNTERRMLPMVKVDKEYAFHGPDGPATLAELFGGARQLIVQHFMFHPDWDAGCSSCTASVDEIAPGMIEHLRVRDTAFVVVSRAPIEKIEAYRARKGWDIRWYSSYGSDFNYDYHVTLDDAVTPIVYNYRTADEWAAIGKPLYLADLPAEQPGYSMFLRDGDEIFHTYSVFGRGTENLHDSYGFLDHTALGRQEEWEKPAGRSGAARAAVPDFSS